MEKILIAISIFCLFSAPLRSQFGMLSFDSYTIENGLSQNSVYSICQTKDGLLWIGTNDGINRFDGKDFKVYRPKTEDNISRSSVIQSIITTNDHQLIVATGNELLVFDTRSQKFYPIKKYYPKFEFPDKVQIVKLYKDKHQTLWVLTQTMGVFSYNFSTNSTLHFFEKPRLDEKFTDITLDPKGRVILSTETNVYVYKNHRFVPITFPKSFNRTKINIREVAYVGKELWVASHEIGVQVFTLDTIEEVAIPLPFKYKFQEDVSEILVCNSGEVWLGSRSHGLIKYEEGTSTMQIAQGSNEAGRLSKNFILSMFEDQKGNVWIGLSGGGLQKYRRPHSLFSIIKSPDNLPSHDAMTFCITSVDDHDFYLGTLIGGLAIYNKQKQEFKYYIDPKLPAESINIYSIVPDGDTMWLATWAGLCSFNIRTKTFNYYPDRVYGIGDQLYSAIVIDHKKLLLLSGEKGLVYFDIKTKNFLLQPPNYAKLPEALITARQMQKENQNEVWMATVTHNFIRYNVLTGKVQYYPQFTSISSSARYYCLKEDTLWLATNDGLIQSNIRDFSVQKLWNKNDGLADDFVYAVLVDKKNNVWISTNRGISRINVKNKRINNYSKKDGLQDLEFNTASCMKTKVGNLLFGGINGINEIEIDSIKNINYTVKPIITGIHVLNVLYEPDTACIFKKKLKLRYYQNFISFDFIGPNAINQDELNYKYRLKGVDSDWINAKFRTFVSYTQLRPGKYIFEVVSIDKNGNESEPNEGLVIEIEKPFWLSYGFIGLVIFTLLISAYSLLKFRWNQIKKKNTINHRMAELEMAALQSQMNPHFIFNCLNSISEMILMKDNLNASKYLNKFARLIRTTLEHSTQEWISLDASIIYVEQYLEMEQLRMGDLAYIITVDDELKNHTVKLPPHILQPLIENAIWHGVSVLKTKKIIHIKCFRFNQNVVIEIDDNGVGINHAVQSKITSKREGSIINMRKRIALIREKYNFEIILEIIDKKDNVSATETGTIVKLILPLDLDS